MNAGSTLITNGLGATPAALLVPGFFGAGSTPPPPVPERSFGLFSEIDLLGMLKAIGRSVTINGVAVTADFRLKAADINLYSGVVESTGPTCRVTATMVASLGIGHGSTIAVSGTTYYVTQVNEETSGFVNLALTLNWRN